MARWPFEFFIRATALLQLSYTDGNLVIYGTYGTVAWKSGTDN